MQYLFQKWCFNRQELLDNTLDFMGTMALCRKTPLAVGCSSSGLRVQGDAGHCQHADGECNRTILLRGRLRLALSSAISAPPLCFVTTHNREIVLFVNVPIKNAQMERGTWKSGVVSKENRLRNVMKKMQHSEIQLGERFYSWKFTNASVLF